MMQKVRKYIINIKHGYLSALLLKESLLKIKCPYSFFLLKVGQT